MKITTSFFYLFALVSLLIYSYSQVDLNLTLSSYSVYQSFQRQLTNLGYFERPLSTLIYIVIVTILISTYISQIYQAKNKISNSSNIFKLVLTTSTILLLAYPAFSFDIFNYIFDARIVITHHDNPWLITALDFPDDLWTRFMRWTHRTYPYGPAWLLFTLPFYAVGFGKFVLTLISFKTIGLISYLGSVFAIYKISSKFNKKLTTLSMALYAFNPLIIIETLVSTHIDAAMGLFMLVGIWLVSANQKTIGWISTLFSAGIKFVSIGTVPFLVAFQMKKLSFTNTIIYSTISLYIITIFVILQREILPWYFITPFSLTALIPHKKNFTVLMIGITIATLARYIPFLYTGGYTAWVLQIRDMLTYTILLGTIAYYFINHKVINKPRN